MGRSDIVGKPMALLLIHANATVTVCHSKTRDLKDVVRRADIVVVAMGRAAMVTTDYIRPGATVIDVGQNVITDAAQAERIFAKFPEKIESFRKKGSVLVGDVHPDVIEIAGAFTPVPGGVGPLTIAMLMSNTVRAARLRRGQAGAAPPLPCANGAMLRVGLTGGIGCGKSTVAAMMRELGCHVLDADELAHRAHRARRGRLRRRRPRIRPRHSRSSGPRGPRQTRRHCLRRSRAPRATRSHHPSAHFRGARAGASPHSKKPIRTALPSSKRPCWSKPGYYKQLDRLIVVWCRPEQQFARLTDPAFGRGMSSEQAQRRIAAQLDLAEKRKLADDEIDTSGTLEETRRQVVALVEKLKRLAA